MGQPFRLSADPYKIFYIIVPRGYVLITNRPVNPYPLFGIRFEIQIAPPVTHPSPGQATSTHMVSPEPVEGAMPLHIGVFPVTDIKQLVPLILDLALNGVLGLILLSDPQPVFEIPWIQKGCGIVFHMLDIPAPLQQ